jgi:hypothetical protein
VNEPLSLRFNNASLEAGKVNRRELVDLEG